MKGGDSSEAKFRTPAMLSAGWPLLLIAIVGVAAALYELREDALADARRSIANLALILGEQITGSVQAIDLGLRDLQKAVIEQRGDTPRAFVEVASRPAFRQTLKDKRALISQAELLTVVDARGRLLNTSLDETKVGLDVSDRDYFRYLSQNADSELFIGAPVQVKGTGEWTIFLARRIDAADRSFLGLVVAGVRLRYFEDIYRAIDLPHGETFLLLRRDGTALVRHPDPIRRAGQKMPQDSPWYDVAASGGGFYRSPGYFDGLARLVAVRPIDDFPLVINASISEDAVLATWRRQAVIRGGAAAVIFAYAALLMRLSHRQFIRLRTSREAVLQQNADLVRLSDEVEQNRKNVSARTQELHAILNTMDQGLLMVDRKGHVVHCNERARELLDIPAEFIEVKPLFTDVLAYQWETNLSGRDEENFEAFVRKRTVSDVPHIQELKRPDGRVLEVRGVPMPGGGFVRTYTDITARKNAEDRVRYLAHHDDLTRLTNRVAFRERLAEAFSMARSSRRGAALLCLDLDHFKEVNDALGHEAGDAVLAEAAQRMRASVRMIDTVARLGGDEFAIILPFLDDVQTAEDLAQQLIASIGKPYTFGKEFCLIGVSVGIAIFPQDADSVEGLMSCADQALYAAKRAGRNIYRLVDHAARAIAQAID